MDQHENAGHHAITREAVRLFFEHVHPADGKIDGMTEEQYFHALDRAQYNQDVAGVVGGHEIPTYGTSVPADVDGAAQRQHGMADPLLTGQQNLDADRGYVEGEVAASRHGNKMQHLGAAAHALEDSYSEAHAWRSAAANSGDPTARVESINVWDPVPGAYYDPTHGIHGAGYSGGIATGLSRTHDERFDEVPVAAGTDLDHLKPGEHVQLVHGSDRAAAAATAGMLEAAYNAEQHHDTDAQAAAEVHATVGQYYQSAQGGPHVNLSPDSVWTAEHDARLREHQAEDRAWQAAHPGQHMTSSPGHAHPAATAHPAAPSAAPHNDDALDGGVPPGGVGGS